jgi:hypothetical protein
MAERTDEQAPSASSSEVEYWKDEITNWERLCDKWQRRGRKILKKYKDVRSPRDETITRYNILWANVQTRLPALYARNPKVVVERRYRDADPVGRVSSEVLERSIQYTLDHCNDAWQVNRQVVLDFELPGRGTVWLRYVPHFKKPELDAAEDEKRPAEPKERAPAAGMDNSAAAPTEAAQPLPTDPPGDADDSPQSETAATGVQLTNAEDDEVDEATLSYEETKLDYVYWEDYGHTWARVDDEVRGKWRRVYMDREELEERFLKSEENPDGLTEAEIAAIPLDWAPKSLNDTKIPVSRKKAIVYEIWDKRRRNILWMVKNYPKLLDKRRDMLGLKDFFPCPRALAANLTNEDMLPTPNYTFYQDQANEIDELSTRIVAIEKALKVAGVRDASAEGLDRLLAEGVENALIPIKGWSAMKEKGGLAGSFELLPLEQIANALSSIREMRQELIEDVYQLTGISDIVRGMSDPTETATAQQLKGQFSMVRIEDAQAEVQRFCRDEVVIIGQIVAGYDIETLKAISGVKLLTAAEKQQIQLQLAAQQRAQQMQAMAQPAPPSAAGAPPGMPPHPGVPGPAPPSAPMMAPPHTSLPPTLGGTPPPGAPPAMGAPSPGPMPQAMPQPGGQMTPGHMAPGAPSTPMTPAPGQAPVSPEKLKLLELPTWEEVEALLKNPVLREFKLDIETDSTIKMDEDAEKRARLELIETAGQFVQQAVMAGMQAPEILPMLGELLMFGIRAFRTARSVEQTFEDMMQALNKAASQPRPNPEVAKEQAKAAAQQQSDQLRAQTDQAIAERKGQMDMQLQQHENALEDNRLQAKAKMDIDMENHRATLKQHSDQVMEEIRNHFESQRIQFETHAKERLESMKINAESREKERDRQHQSRMTQAQHEHEKSMPKPTGGGNQKAA